MNLHLVRACTFGLCSLYATSALESIAFAQTSLEDRKVNSLELTPSQDWSQLIIPETQSNSTPTQVKVRVKKINVLGSTAFTSVELAEVVAPLIGKELTFEELSVIRSTITELYVSKGYITSGVFLPPQKISTGVIQVQVVEGELEEIEFQCKSLPGNSATSEKPPVAANPVVSELLPTNKCGLRRLPESYVTSRLTRAVGTPLNIFKLQEALQQLQQNPLFSSVQAELVAGSSPEKSVLILSLTQAPAINSALVIDNKNSSAVGSIGATAALSHNNFIGLGDRLNVEAGITEGINTYSLDYALPLNPKDGTLTLSASRGRSRIIEEPFAPLDINSRQTTYSIGFRQPLIRSLNTEIGLSLSADLRRSRTFLFDDEPFSFNLGAENGESNVTAIRFAQDWTSRTANRVIAARSQFSLGLGLLGATTNDTGTDGRFFSWQGQAQWIQAINPRKDIILVSRIAAQLTPDSLLLGEQIAIGGIDSVRGYQHSYLVGDSGIVGSVELQLPIISDIDGIGTVQLVPFFDVGAVWSNNNLDSTNNTLASLGIGLRYQLSDYLYARLDWGIPLVSIENRGDSLQDNGLSFSIRLEPF